MLDLVKKMVLADSLERIADAEFKPFSQYSTPIAWVFCLSYAFEIIRISGSAEWRCASGESGLEARRFHWLIQAVIAFLLIATVAISLNIGIDIYGVCRETKGRHLVDYGDDRIAKCLSSEHYVHRNFDAILIGSSLISKWDTHGIHTLRTYNESLNGSNFEEQEALVGRAVASPGLKTAFILIHPSMTAEHDFTTVQLTGEERWTRAWLIELAGRLQRLVKRYRKPGSPLRTITERTSSTIQFT